MEQTLQERGVGEVVGQAFGLVFGKFGKLLAIHLLFWVPVGIVGFGLVAALAASSEDATAALVSAFAGLLLLLLLQPVPNAASMIALADPFTGRNTSIGQCFARAFRKLVTLIGIGILVALPMVLGGVVIGIVAAASGALASLFVLVGIVLALMWYCACYCAAQAAVLEDVPAARALGRSFELTKGHRGQVFLVIIVFGIIGALIGYAVQALTGGLTGDAGSGGLGEAILQIFSQLVNGMLGAAAGVAVYFNQRVRKENFGVEELVSLVDEIGARGGAGR